MGIVASLKRLARRYAPRPVMEWRQRRASARFANASAREVFSEIYRNNSWGDQESRSGVGSRLEATSVARSLITTLVRELDVQVFHDIPCGDFNWMKEVDLGNCRYVGSDIVPELIDSNRTKYAREGREFRVLDLIADPLPKADLVLVRDCLIHLSFKDLFSAFRNLRASGSSYLLTNTYPEHVRNYDTNTGGARPLNLLLPPFRLPEPLRFARETFVPDPTGAPTDKSLVLYRIEDLPTDPRE